MFNFKIHPFKTHKKKAKLDLVVEINGHDIMGNKQVAVLISDKFQNFSEKVVDGQLTSTLCIEIPEFNDQYSLTDTDLNIFQRIFAGNEIHISYSNVDTLKVFASYFKMESLTNKINIFISTNQKISTDNKIQIQNQLVLMLKDITEENTTELILSFEEDGIFGKDIDDDFLIEAIYVTMQIQSRKIDLLLKIIKELDQNIRKNIYSVFQNYVIADFKEIQKSYFVKDKREIHFIVRRFLETKEVDISQVIISQTKPIFNLTLSLFFDMLSQSNKELPFTDKIMDYFIEVKGNNWERYTKCLKKGKSTSKLYEILKNDSLNELTEYVRVSENFNFDIKIVNVLEINSDLYKINGRGDIIPFSILEICSFYGSQKCFDFILLNGGNASQTMINFSFIGGNISIVMKCKEIVEKKMYSDKEELVLLNKKSFLYAVKHFQQDVFEWMIEMLDPNNQLFKDIINNPVFLECAVKYNNFSAIFYMISIGVDYKYLLSYSLLYNNFHLANLAIDLDYANESDPFKSKTDDGEPPLFIAMYKNRIDIVTKIVKKFKGINLNQIYDKLTPLFFAIYHDKIDVINFFLDEEDIRNKINFSLVCNDSNFFSFAIFNQKKMIVDNFIKKCPELDFNAPDRNNKDNNRPIHYACYYGYLDVIKFLVEVCKIDINIPNVLAFFIS